LDFLQKDYFDNIALFEYHDEPLAASSKLPGKVDDKTLKTRFIQADDIVDKLLTKKEKQRK
jgi:tRNA A37 methylthiotransferase MiaB